MKETKGDLGKLTTKELLVIAKELDIKGRHEMRKENLIEAIVAKQAEMEPKQSEEVDVEMELAVGSVSEWHDSELLIDSCDNGTKKIPKPKVEYIDNAKVGTIIAFKVNEEKIISGMIEEVHRTEFVVKTKNGVRFTVRRKNVVWVKTGPRWPRGVYLALKGETNNEE